MIAVRLFGFLYACATMQYVRVHGASLAEDPMVPRPSNGLSTLNDNCMVAVFAIDPFNYTLGGGHTSAPQGESESEGEEGGEGLESGFIEKDTSDVSFWESKYDIKSEMNADVIHAKWPSAEANTAPWPGNYWATYLDGINVEINGTMSPAEKYARAQGINHVEFMDTISAMHGIDQYSSWPECEEDSECDEDSGCAIRTGKTTGYCIPKWFGLCHAWAPAALQQPEPKCPVEVNGVEFSVTDIKALLTEAYAGLNLTYMYAAVRTEVTNPDKKDEYGRYVDLVRRDVNPALFHVLLANIVGRLEDLFVVDADSDVPVWNQPVRSYEFSDPVEMTPEEAAQEYFNVSSYDDFNPVATRIYYVVNKFKFIQEGFEDGMLSTPDVVDEYTTTKTYEYLLELDDDGTILGGEWVGESRRAHPDFLWRAVDRPTDGSVTDTGLEWDFVNWLNSASQEANC